MKHKRWILLLAAAVLGTLTSIFIFFAQTRTITGVVRDLSGKTIAGAKIMGGIRETKTDAQGNFKTRVKKDTTSLTAAAQNEYTTIEISRSENAPAAIDAASIQATAAPAITDVFETEEEAFQGLPPEEVELIQEEMDQGYYPQNTGASLDENYVNVTLPIFPEELNLPPPVDANDIITNEEGLEVVKGEILVGWQEGAEEDERAKLVKKADAETRYDDPSGFTSILYVPDQKKVKTVIAALQKSKLVIGAMENFTLEPDQAPNDPDWNDKNKSWWLRKLNAEPLWAATAGRNSTIVAVIDAGFQIDHPDLAVAFTRANLNYTTGAITDTPKHGTHVAGIIAARKDNSLGLAGIAPKVRILPIRLWDFGRLPSVYTTLAQHPQLRIATMSMGWKWSNKNQQRVAAGKAPYTNAQMQAHTDTYDRIIRRSFLDYYHAGGMMCKSAGNDSGMDARLNLLNYVEVITVGSSEPNGTLSNFSNIGPKVDILAPGRRIWSTLPPGTYGPLSGTSMSTPAVCGTVAAIRSVRPNLGPLLIKRILTYSGSHGDSVTQTGYPHLDSWRALLRATKLFGVTGGVFNEDFDPLKQANINTKPELWNVLTNEEGEFVLPFLKRQPYTLHVKKGKVKGTKKIAPPPTRGDEVIEEFLMLDKEEETNENANGNENANTADANENADNIGGKDSGTGSGNDGSEGTDSADEGQILPNGVVISKEGCAVSGFTVPTAEGDCAPGFSFSRETIACEQITCPEGVGRTYTLECKCPENTSAVYACNTPGYVVACVADKQQ